MKHHDIKKHFVNSSQYSPENKLTVQFINLFLTRWKLLRKLPDRWVLFPPETWAAQMLTSSCPRGPRLSDTTFWGTEAQEPLAASRPSQSPTAAVGPQSPLKGHKDWSTFVW